MHDASLRLQSHLRMRTQRRAYLRELKEKAEEAKLSNQLAKMQARLQAEIEARQQAEQEQERLKAERDSGAGAASTASVAASAASATPAACAPAAQPSQGGDVGAAAASLGGLAGAAAKYLSGRFGAPQSTTAMEETSVMLSLVTKDREKLSQRLATEIETRKRLEGEKRELERKLRLGSATSQVCAGLRGSLRSRCLCASHHARWTERVAVAVVCAGARALWYTGVVDGKRRACVRAKGCIPHAPSAPAPFSVSLTARRPPSCL